MVLEYYNWKKYRGTMSSLLTPNLSNSLNLLTVHYSPSRFRSTD